MPSLRKRVSSYFRQLSFHNEPREKRNINENSFVTKYLQGEVKLREGPPIVHGKNPTDLPNYDLCLYKTGPESIVGCYTGPSGGCSTIKRQEKHLTMAEQEIDFIDTPEDSEIDERCVSSTHQSPAKMTIAPPPPQPTTTNHRTSATLDISTMQIRVAGQTYNITPRPHSATATVTTTVTATSQQRRHSKSHSLVATLSECDLASLVASNGANVTLPRSTAQHNQLAVEESNGNVISGAVAAVSDLSAIGGGGGDVGTVEDKGDLAKSKSEGNPFKHKKRKEGRIIRIVNRPTGDNETLVHSTDDQSENVASSSAAISADAVTACSVAKLPPQWRRSSEYAYGVAHSLYDKNPVTGRQNGDPIADCFGLVTRKDSAMLAVADGVNWGEKACIAAKSAIHAALHYLNTTLFHDDTLFTPTTTTCSTLTTPPHSRPHCPPIAHTRDVFVALLRAFNCAHDLILERGGMLTTLTVAVVLPVRGRSIGGGVPHVGVGAGQGAAAAQLGQRYVCCVCNVGDTLAYVYSQRDGIRELTKGSHDINCNRDMRDALGALGPVDGHNPELSNLTLSITTVQRGDIILVASDGLTDNFDPNVCKFTVSGTTSNVATNTTVSVKANAAERKKSDSGSVRSDVSGGTCKVRSVELQVPVKPPRKKNYIAMNRDSVSRSSAERSERSSVSSQRSKSSAIEDTASNNPLIAQFIRENSVEPIQAAAKSDASTSSKLDDVSTLTDVTNIKCRSDSATSQTAKELPVAAGKVAKRVALPIQKSTSMKAVPKGGKAGVGASQNSPPSVGFSFLRSKTLVDFRPTSSIHKQPQIARNSDGVPYVTPLQRYELTLLLMEDILKRGITGRDEQCVTARKLCQELYNFTISLTNAKRKTLEEDSDLYYNTNKTEGGGVLVEIGAMERKARRKRALERVQALPGKLDHVTIVACNVGMW